MSDLPHCQVCSQIITFFKTAYSQRSVEFDLGKLNDVISMPCPHSGSIRKLWESRTPQDTPAPKSWSVEIIYHTLDPATIMRFISSQPDQQNIQYYVELVANDELEHPVTALVPDSQWIDPSVPKSWFSQCLHDHGSECNEPEWMKLHPGTNADPDWVIDVMDQCIVPFGSDTKGYVTLSCTWGNSPCLKTTTVNFEAIEETRVASLSPSPKHTPDYSRRYRDNRIPGRKVSLGRQSSYHSRRYGFIIKGLEFHASNLRQLIPLSSSICWGRCQPWTPRS